MIEENGQVSRTEGEFAWVVTERRSSCGSCSAQKGCGTGAVAGLFAAKPHEVKVHNPVGARPGDTVVIGISESLLLRGSVAVYLVPLLTMLAGGIVASQWGGGGGDALAAAGGLAGLVAGFVWLGWRNRHWARDAAHQAVILRTSLAGGAVPVNFLTRH